MRYQCSRRFTCIIIVFYIGMICHKRISSTGGYVIVVVIFNVIRILFAIKGAGIFHPSGITRIRAIQV